MKTSYETQATAQGGRRGSVKTDDGLLDFEVRMPSVLGGKGGEYTNPEQLFATGYAACYDNALISVALASKHKISSETTVHVALNIDDDKSASLGVKIESKIEGVDTDTAKQLMQQAHAVCPYSKAIKGNIDVDLSLV